MNLIVDDDTASCERMKELLVLCGINAHETETSSDPEAALEHILRGDYDIVFLDVDMPRMNGIELIRSLREQRYEGCVIFTTGHEKYAVEALRNAAADYLLKPVDLDELKAALKRYRENRSRRPKNFDKLSAYGLTRRQVEIAKRIFEGKTSAEIAEDLFLSKHTVDTHRRTILRKTGCKNTTELFRLL